MPTTLRVNDPRELISLVPYQLGFRPRSSVVLISLRGERRRVGLVVRLDLAALADRRDAVAVARSALAHVRRDGARDVVVVLYLESDDRARPAPDVLRARRAVHRATTDDGVGVLGTWCVTPTGWFEADCRVDACCPPGGRPPSDLESTAVSAEMVLNGAAVVESRADLATVPTAPSEARRAARKASARWAARARAARSTAEIGRWRRDGLALWRAERDRAACALAVGGGSYPAGWEAPAAVVLGRLQAALDDVLVRDAVMLGFVPGAEDVSDRVVSGDDGPEVSDCLARIVDPERGIRPDLQRTAAARTVLEQVVGHVRDGRHAAGLTLLAVLAWWEGDGARAAVLVERALDADPAHRLAVLLAEALDQGMPPGWVRRGADAPS